MEVADLGNQRRRRPHRDTAQSLDGCHHGRERPGRQQPADGVLMPLLPSAGDLDALDQFLEDDLFRGWAKLCRASQLRCARVQ